METQSKPGLKVRIARIEKLENISYQHKHQLRYHKHTHQCNPPRWSAPPDKSCPAWRCRRMRSKNQCWDSLPCRPPSPWGEPWDPCVALLPRSSEHNVLAREPEIRNVYFEGKKHKHKILKLSLFKGTEYEIAFFIKFLQEWYSYLFSLGWTSEDDSLVQLSLACILDLGVRVQLSQVNVVNEGDVVWGMPVKTVAVHVKWDLK